LDFVSHRFIAAHSFGKHCGKHRHTAIHIIVDENIALAVVEAVEVANVLL
jgi:hypothetical protein